MGALSGDGQFCSQLQNLGAYFFVVLSSPTFAARRSYPLMSLV